MIAMLQGPCRDRETEQTWELSDRQLPSCTTWSRLDSSSTSNPSGASGQSPTTPVSRDRSLRREIRELVDRERGGSRTDDRAIAERDERIGPAAESNGRELAAVVIVASQPLVVCGEEVIARGGDMRRIEGDGLRDRWRVQPREVQLARILVDRARVLVPVREHRPALARDEVRAGTVDDELHSRTAARARGSGRELRRATRPACRLAGRSDRAARSAGRHRPTCPRIG